MMWTHECYSGQEGTEQKGQINKEGPLNAAADWGSWHKIPYSANFSRGNNFVVFKNPRTFQPLYILGIEPRPFKLKVKGRLRQTILTDSSPYALSYDPVPLLSRLRKVAFQILMAPFQLFHHHRSSCCQGVFTSLAYLIVKKDHMPSIRLNRRH